MVLTNLENNKNVRVSPISSDDVTGDIDTQWRIYQRIPLKHFQEGDPFYKKEAIFLQYLKKIMKNIKLHIKIQQT
jgi:hypothetical protein